VSAKDAMAKGMTGKDIGDWVRRKEMELFLR
jgi:hypothetical protein